MKRTAAVLLVSAVGFASGCKGFQRGPVSADAVPPAVDGPASSMGSDGGAIPSGQDAPVSPAHEASVSPASEASAPPAPEASIPPSRDVPVDMAPDASVSRDAAVGTPEASAPDGQGPPKPDAAAGFVAAPAAVIHDVSNPAGVELFAVTAAGRLARLVREGAAAGSLPVEPRDLGAPPGTELVGSPTAISWEKDRVDVFVRGVDERIYQRHRAGGVWQPWVWIDGPPFPPPVSADPGVSSWGVERLDLFARGARDGDLVHRWYELGWRYWESLQGTLASAPAAVSTGFERIDVFARGPGGDIVHLPFDRGWGSWRSLGGSFTFGPAVASRRTGMISLFAADAQGRLFRMELGSAAPATWVDVGLTVPGEFRVLALDGRQVLVLAVVEGRLWERLIQYE